MAFYSCIDLCIVPALPITISTSGRMWYATRCCYVVGFRIVQVERIFINIYIYIPTKCFRHIQVLFSPWCFWEQVAAVGYGFGMWSLGLTLDFWVFKPFKNQNQLWKQTRIVLDFEWTSNWIIRCMQLFSSVVGSELKSMHLVFFYSQVRCPG